MTRSADPVARAASEVIGGPRGRYAVSRELPWVLTAALLSALTAVTAGFGILLRIPCLRTGFAGIDQFWNACYADLPTTYRDANVKAGLAAYLQGGAGAPETGQPPLTGLALTAVASLVPDGSLNSRAAWFFALWSVLVTLLLLVIVWLVASSAHPPISAAHVALSPVVALTAFISADLLGVALATAGLWAWSRRSPTLAGVLLGLAISARSYPVLLLLAIGLLCLRSGRLRDFARTAAYAVLTFGVVLSAVWLVNPAAASSAYSNWVSASAGYGSPWLLPQLAGNPLPAGAVTALAVAGWFVALLAGAVLALSSARRPTVAEVSLVMVAIVLVTGKSFTVQSSLWLVPLVAWCAVQWRDHLIWAGAEALNFVAVWLTIAATTVPDRGLPAAWYSFFSMLRVVAVLWLAAVVWLRARERWDRPEDRGRRRGCRRRRRPRRTDGRRRRPRPGPLQLRQHQALRPRAAGDRVPPISGYAGWPGSLAGFAVCLAVDQSDLVSVRSVMLGPGGTNATLLSRERPVTAKTKGGGLEACVSTNSWSSSTRRPKSAQSAPRWSVTSPSSRRTAAPSTTSTSGAVVASPTTSRRSPRASTPSSTSPRSRPRPRSWIDS